MIEVKGLRGGYGRREVVKGVSFGLERGELLALLGPNGSGKTTLLRLILGLLKPKGGQVLVDGVPRAGIPWRKFVRQVGFVLGELVPWDLKVLDYIRLSSPRRPAEEALELAGLEPGARLAELSSGELARARLARAWAQDPDYYLLDEPTAHLDPPHASWALELLRDEAKRGKGVLIVLHDVNLARRATRALLLREGRIIAEGLTPENLRLAYGAEVREEPGFSFSPPPRAPGARSP